MAISPLLVYTAGTILLFYLARSLFNFLHKIKKLWNIPTPKAWPVLGHSKLLLSSTEQINNFFRECAISHYPIYQVYAFYTSIAVQLLDPNDIEIVLCSSKHTGKTKMYTFLKQWLGTGLLLSEGRQWQQRRKILTPAFHFSILPHFVNIFNEETEGLVSDLKQQCGNIIDVVPPVTSFTLKSIGITAMGFSGISEKVQTEYSAAVYKMGQIVIHRMLNPLLRVQTIYNLSKQNHKETEIVKVLHSFSNTIILKRQKKFVESIGTYSNRKHLAMLDLLLKAQKEGANIDNDGIREEVDTFMFEGHDTTAMAISYLLLTLANHPEHQTRVYNEIVDVIGLEKAPTYSDLLRMKFTEQCIKETLRIFPSVPLISRTASEDFVTTTGHNIPKGTPLHIHIFDLHRNARFYRDPLKFDPGRFLPEEVNKRHPFAYIPFSAGPRNCIGQKFAVLELKAALCGILRNFILEKVDDMGEIEFKLDLVLRPAKEIRVRVLPRHRSVE